MSAIVPGTRVGRLLVLSKAGRRGNSLMWNVRCDCGVEKVLFQQQLTRPNGRVTKSCGCLAREIQSTRNLRHGGCVGGKATAEYSAWQMMKCRCYNPNGPGFQTHGARGIIVCDRWLGATGFESFLSDMGDKPSDKHSLDRIDNDGNYEPSNCRWATSTQQMANTRTARRLEIDGEILTLSAAAKRIGVSRSTLQKRLRRMSLAEAVSCKRFTQPAERKLGEHNRVFMLHGNPVCLGRLAKLAGIAWPSMKKRLSRMTPEEALAHPRGSRRKAF